MFSFWSRVGSLIQYDWCLYKKRRNTETQRQDAHMKMETEIGVMLPQAKEHLRLPEAGKDKEGFSTWGFGRSRACWHLDFELLSSRAVIITQFVVICYSSPRKRIQAPRPEAGTERQVSGQSQRSTAPWLQGPKLSTKLVSLWRILHVVTLGPGKPGACKVRLALWD